MMRIYNKFHIGNILSYLSYGVTRIAACFMPLVPAIIASGLISIIIRLMSWLSSEGFLSSYINFIQIIDILTLISVSVPAYLVIQVGMNAAGEFGGARSLGGAVSAITITPMLTHLSSIRIPLAGSVIILPGEGGLVAGMVAGILSAWSEKKVRAYFHETFSELVAPCIALLFSGIMTLFLVMPLSALLIQEVSSIITWSLYNGYGVGHFILASSFIFLHLFGLNQALIPLHMQLIAQYGFSSLFPILAMAGGGEGGAGIALWCIFKDKEIISLIRRSLVICILGVGEPLLFSVLLPLGWPLFTASIGAGCGALVLGYAAMHGDDIGATSIGTANLLLVPFIRGNRGIQDILIYLFSLIIAYLVSFSLTIIFGLFLKHAGKNVEIKGYDEYLKKPNH